jgi:hypothetical protein
MNCRSILFPLLLERVGKRRIKSHVIPLIPAPSTLLRAGFSRKGEGADSYIDAYALINRGNHAAGNECKTE